MDFRLQKLTLSNFKGVRSFEFEPGGESVLVYGANETGKTTLADAVTFLLFDKDTLGRQPANFGIKTLENGEPLHGVDHEVEGVFNTVTLKKIYKEKWVKKNGSAESVLDTHTTDYFVDGVPKKKKDYQEAVSNIMSEDLFKMLTLPDYFANSMHWKERRAVLTEMAGEINDEEILSAHPDLAEYPSILDGKNEEDAIDMLKGERKELNKQLDNIPSRIDELNRLITPVEGLEEAKAEIASLKEKRSAIEGKISEVKSGGNVADMRVKISEHEAEKSELVNTLNEKNNSGLENIRKKLTELNSKRDQIDVEYRKQTNVYRDAESAYKSAADAVTQKQVEIEQEQNKKPEPDKGEELCPVCDRPMEKEDGHSYEDYVREFNSTKALKLKDLKDELESLQVSVNEAKVDLDKATEDGLKIKARLNQVDGHIQKVQKELDQAKAEQPDPKEDPEYKLLEAKQNELRNRIEAHEEDKAERVAALNKLVDELNEQIQQAERVIHQVEENAKYTKRIAELQEDRKEYSDKLEEAEHSIHIIEEFGRSRSRFITDRVNKLFKNVEWRLFVDQINGGVTETADAIYKGVPFSEGLNNAGRIQAGLEIIEALTKHYGKSAPIVVDNRESVTTLPDTDLQVISLIVSPEDKKLRVERANEMVAA